MRHGHGLTVTVTGYSCVLCVVDLFLAALKYWVKEGWDWLFIFLQDALLKYIPTATGTVTMSPLLRFNKLPKIPKMTAQ
jgi:hypothetical protein